MNILEILIVEDEPSNREIAEVILCALGHRVTACENGQAALELCDQRSFDLVLMDVLTPVMDGIRATKVLRSQEKTKNLPIVCISGKASGSDEMAGMLAGCDAYLRKPYRRRDLLNCLTQVLRSRGVLGPGEKLGE